MNATTSRKLSMKIDGTVPTPRSHPLLFASHLRPKAAAEAGLAFADAYFTAKRGTAPRAAAPAAPAAAGADACRNFSPAALDRMRGGPPVTEATAEQVDAYFASRRAARERTGRRH